MGRHRRGEWVGEGAAGGAGSGRERPTRHNNWRQSHLCHDHAHTLAACTLEQVCKARSSPPLLPLPLASPRADTHARVHARVHTYTHIDTVSFSYTRDVPRAYMHRLTPPLPPTDRRPRSQADLQHLVQLPQEVPQQAQLPRGVTRVKLLLRAAGGGGGGGRARGGRQAHCSGGRCSISPCPWRLRRGVRGVGTCGGQLGWRPCRGRAAEPSHAPGRTGAFAAGSCRSTHTGIDRLPGVDWGLLLCAAPPPAPQPPHTPTRPHAQGHCMESPAAVI